MKVILHKEVEKLGIPGDVVEVKDGYARNYLVPRGLAAPASKGSVKHAERLRLAHDDRVRRMLEDARALAATLSAKPIRIAVRAGDDGRLFGSVTAPDLAREIEAAAGVAIDRRQIRLEEPIRSVGAHEVLVHLHPDVNATVTVEVAPTT
jgi:large subunit ribosomal protein L9